MKEKREKIIERYWVKKLSAPLPKVVLPEFENENKKNDGVTATLQYEIPQVASNQMTKISNNINLGLYILFLSGVNIVLNHYTGINDLIIGTVTPKREGVKDNLIFCRQKMTDKLLLKTFINQIKHSVLQDFNHGQYSFGVIYQSLLEKNNSDSIDIFNMACIYEKLQNKIKLLNQFDLIFILSGADDNFTLKVEYKENIYSSEMIMRFSKNLIHFFENISENLNLEISKINILNRNEVLELSNFNKTHYQYHSDKTITELFEAQVKKSPNRVAIVHNDKQLTYMELNERTGDMARFFKEKGVQPNTPVGVMMERSIEMIIGIMGILKAGGAYVPIDPEFPTARISDILNDCNISILLTESNILNAHSFSNLKGLDSKSEHVFLTPPRSQITDLDHLPMVDRSLVNYDKYRQYIGVAPVKNSITIQATRGCPYRCIYCHKLWPKNHVFRSAEDIFEEVKHYFALGVRRFTIVDDIFNLNRENSMRFFDLIIKNKWEIQLFFPSGFRADLLTRDYIDLIVNAGTVDITLALETASPRMQKLIRKNLNLGKLRENIDYICEKYPQVILELQTMLGFPSETKEEALLTLDFIKKTKWIHFPYLHIVRIYHNTDMEKLALEMGIEKKNISMSKDLAWHELPFTLPFDKKFVINYQTDFLNEYFLLKERLLHVLPKQMKIMTENEILQKYNSYLAIKVNSFSELMQYMGITEEEIDQKSLPDRNVMDVPNLDDKIKKASSFYINRNDDGLRILLLDLSQFFSNESENMLYDVVEAPLGLMNLSTYLEERIGNKINVKIAKSRIDFDNFKEFRLILNEFEPEIIGIRSLTFYRDFFHKTVALIRYWGINVPIIAGGPYATSDYNHILQDKNVDLAVIGEGEVTFLELIKKILENQNQIPHDDELKKIPGLAFIPVNEKLKKEYSREVILFDSIKDVLFNQKSKNFQNTYNSTHLAYIMYTSGTTGMSKGVLVEHRNLLNVLGWFAKTYNVDKDTHVLQLTKNTFDPSAEQIFGTLLHGAALFIGDKELTMSEKSFTQFIEKYQINVFNFVPIVLKELICKNKKLKSLHAVISGGDKLDDSLKNQIIGLGYNLYNQYGPTETTIDAIQTTCNDKNVVLGKPIFNVRCYIINKFDGFVPIGVIGELCIAGAGVSRGYLNNIELTDEKFTFIPSNKSERVYRTGDLARILPDGNIEFFGRSDDQIKIRGYRIELKEIENRLVKIPNIQDAVVVKNKSQMEENNICAYFVPNQSSGSQENSIDISTIREYLKRYLPGYMVPSYFIQLKHIPLNKNGKVDTKNLPPPDLNSNIDYVPPETEIEKILTEIWQKVLNVEKVGININIFEMGGNSFNIIQVTKSLKEYVERDIPVVAMFRYPTIRSFAQFLSNNKEEVTPVDVDVRLDALERGEVDRKKRLQIRKSIEI
jgi:amino acid adenylation domain-containing protein